jgi:hypothetical protein
MDLEQLIYRLPEFLSVLAGFTTALIAVSGALRSGVLKKVRTGDVDLPGIDPQSLERIRAELASARSGDPIPFEIEQLANYYSVTLGQAKISFWFSLVFASIGFIVIIGAAFLYHDGDPMGASIKIISGLIIDAVAALFFVQSRRAQEAMGTFFEKLRTDRQFIEARKICEEIKEEEKKDNLKAILVLHYSGLQSTGMLDVLAGVRPKNHPPLVDQPPAPRRIITPRNSTRGTKGASPPPLSAGGAIHSVQTS